MRICLYIMQSWCHYDITAKQLASLLCCHEAVLFYFKLKKKIIPGCLFGSKVIIYCHVDLKEPPQQVMTPISFHFKLIDFTCLEVKKTQVWMKNVCLIYLPKKLVVNQGVVKLYKFDKKGLSAGEQNKFPFGIETMISWWSR